MIIPVWKKIGESTHQLAKRIGELNNDKATHTGTLDPLAEGIVVVLTGPDRFKKQTLSKVTKIYNFQILFGISTDSLDILGLITEHHKLPQTLANIKEQISALLPNFIGKQNQTQPKFSAQRIQGKSAFDYAKKQIPFIPKTNQIEIYSLKCTSAINISITELQQQIENRISLVSGDFRQKEILYSWKKQFLNLKHDSVLTLPLISVTAVVSHRTYIRSLVQDIAKKLKIPATTFSITRTKNGEFRL